MQEKANKLIESRKRFENNEGEKGVKVMDQMESFKKSIKLNL